MPYKRKDFKDCFKKSNRITPTRELFELYQAKERKDVSWHVFNLLLRTNYGAPDGETTEGEPGYELEFVPGTTSKTIVPTRARKM